MIFKNTIEIEKINVPRKLELTGLLFCFGMVPLAIAIKRVRPMRVAVVFILKNVTMKLK